MGAIHEVARATNVSPRPSAAVAVLCTYTCAVSGPGQAGRSWERAIELARSGYDVWVVTRSDTRSDLQYALDRQGLPNLSLLF
jgi:hypothetical protein